MPAGVKHRRFMGTGRRLLAASAAQMQPATLAGRCPAAMAGMGVVTTRRNCQNYNADRFNPTRRADVPLSSRDRDSPSTFDPGLYPENVRYVYASVITHLDHTNRFERLYQSGRTSFATGVPKLQLDRCKPAPPAGFSCHAVHRPVVLPNVFQLRQLDWNGGITQRLQNGADPRIIFR